MKKGDKVEYVGKTWPERVGWIGEIEYKISHYGSGYYAVNFDGYIIDCFGRSLKLIDVPKKKI